MCLSRCCCCSRFSVFPSSVFCSFSVSSFFSQETASFGLPLVCWFRHCRCLSITLLARFIQFHCVPTTLPLPHAQLHLWFELFCVILVLLCKYFHCLLSFSLRFVQFCYLFHYTHTIHIYINHVHACVVALIIASMFCFVVFNLPSHLPTHSHQPEITRTNQSIEDMHLFLTLDCSLLLNINRVNRFAFL